MQGDRRVLSSPAHAFEVARGVGWRAQYLSGRDLGGKVPHDWNLGFAPGRGVLTRHLSSKGFKADEMVEANVCSRDSQGKLRDRFYNRIMFPINDVAGDCIAFGGRVVGKGEPKYLNSQETPLFHKSQVLYGLDKAKVAMASSGVAIVCEGYTDVIALHEGGVRNAVATLGTALTMRHIRILGRHAQKKIVYLFDGDAAGQKAADRALEFIDSSMTPEAGKTRIELCAVTLPDNLDPAEYMASHSAAELEELIEHAQPLLKYGIDRRLAAHDLSSAEGRSAALASALSVLAPIKDSLLAKDYAIQIAGRTRAREEDVLEALSKLAPPVRYGEASAEEAAAQAPVPAQGPARRALSKTELNRLRLERELLSVLAQNPLIALAHADALAQTKWHDPLHSAIASSILDTLMSDPAASAGRSIVSSAAAVDGRAGRVLTAGRAAPPKRRLPKRLRAFSPKSSPLVMLRTPSKNFAASLPTSRLKEPRNTTSFSRQRRRFKRSCSRSASPTSPSHTRAVCSLQNLVKSCVRYTECVNTLWV